MTKIVWISKKINQGEEIVITDVGTMIIKHDSILKKLDLKHQIYKGIIDFLLESTPYTIRNVAELTNSSVKMIRSIYCDNQTPLHFSAELNLVKLYHMILELHSNDGEIQ